VAARNQVKRGLTVERNGDSYAGAALRKKERLKSIVLPGEFCRYKKTGVCCHERGPGRGVEARESGRTTVKEGGMPRPKSQR